MRITGLLPARNEEWILGFSARAHLMWMDDLIVLNHASTDGTREILEEVQGEVGQERLTIIDHSDPVWRDVAQRQLLLEAGRRADGEYFALLDADEVLTGNLLPQVREFVGGLKPGECMNLPWIAMWKSIFRHRTKAHVTSWATSAFRDAPLLHWRSDKGYDQHRRHPHESTHAPNPPIEFGGIMHFQYVDWRRITAKHALYKMNDAWRFPGRKSNADLNTQYDTTLSEAGLETAATPLEWFWPYRGFADKLKVGEEPWQEAACRELWAKHGPRPFAGLDLYGIVGDRPKLMRMAPTSAPKPTPKLAPHPSRPPRPAPQALSSALTSVLIPTSIPVPPPDLEAELCLIEGLNPDWIRV